MDVRSAAQAGHARSIAILIGVADADHTDHELRPVPATLNSLRAMQRVLTDPNLCGWPGDRVRVLRNPDNAGQTARRLRDLMRSARDTLLVYYAGEANLTTSGQLCLALSDTSPDAPERTGLSYSWVARTLRDSPARRKVVVLDCCLPGRTGQFLDPVSDQIAELSDVEGVYTLTSTTRYHPAPMVTGLQQRARPTVFTGQLVEMVASGLPGGPPDLTFEDLYPALRQRLVSMGLPPPNQRGAGGARQPGFTRNAAPLSARTAAPVAAGAVAAPGAPGMPGASPVPPGPPAPPASARPPERSGPPDPPSPGSPRPPGTPASPPTIPPVLVPASAFGPLPEVGPALAAGPGPAPMLAAGPPPPTMLTAPPSNGARRTNGHGPTTGQTPAVGARPITGQTPVLNRAIAGPEPPRRTPGPDDTPPPPPPTATPLPGSPPPSPSPSPPSPTSPSSSPPGSAKAPDAAPPASRSAGASQPSSPAPRPPTDGPELAGTERSGTEPAGATTTDSAGSSTSQQRGSRRRWLPAVLIGVALLVPTLYVIRPSGKHGSSGSGGGVEVDLRDVGNRTVSLGTGVRAISLLQDHDTLWVQSGSGGTGAELTKIDLATGKVVATVPFPESDSVGTITSGAGSLWVTTSSAENMSGAVVRIDPDSGEKIASVELPAWPGRAVFADGSLWVATVVQPVAEELGATPGAMSSAANALRRIDPATNKLVKSIQLDATPLDVRSADDLVLVSIESSGETAVVAVDPVTEREVARIPVSDDASTGGDPDAAGPWMLFAADPYAVRVDVDAEAIAAVTGPRDGIDMVVPNGEQMWELRAEVLTILDGQGDEVVTVTVDGMPLAAAAAGRGAAWIAYRPSGDDEVLITRVPAAELVDLSE